MYFVVVMTDGETGPMNLKGPFPSKDKAMEWIDMSIETIGHQNNWDQVTINDDGQFIEGDPAQGEGWWSFTIMEPNSENI